MSNTMNIANKLSPNESKTDLLTKPQSLQTCVSSLSPVQLNNIEDLQTWLQQASPASPSQSQESKKPPMMKETCGQPQSESFAKLSQNIACSKMYPVSFQQENHHNCWMTAQQDIFGTFTPFSETWPKQGIMLDGACWELTIAERSIEERGCGLWPSPRASSAMNENTGNIIKRGSYRRRLEEKVALLPTPRANQAMAQTLTETTASHKHNNLETAIAREIFPTPTAADHRDRGGPSNKAIQRRKDIGKSIELSMTVDGALNPDWVELLMEWPKGWTSLEPLSNIEFSKWLMGCERNDKKKGIARKELQALWDSTGKKALQRAIGGLQNIHEAESLLTELRELQGEFNQVWIFGAGEKTQEKFLRMLWLQTEVSCASHRSGYYEQLKEEHTNSLQQLSRFLAHYGQTDWKGDCWENATPRVTTDTKNRKQRLQAIGNGQFSLCVAKAWRILNERP